MTYIVRRKDPPPWEGGPEQKWQTVAHRKTLKEAQQAMKALKAISKPGTAYWCGEETKDEERNSQ